MANTKTSDESDAGALTGAELVRVVRPTGSPPTYADLRTTAQEIADLAPAAGGLYSQVISALPTSASTGLTTWANQGSATVADDATGVTIYSPSNGAVDNFRLRWKTAPATPYTATALVGFTASTITSFPACGFGWYDGTKLQCFSFGFGNAAAQTPRLVVRNLTDVSTLSTILATAPDSIPTPFWCRLKDDGTTVSFQISWDGVHFATLYSVAKASGFLGSGGYTRIWYGVNAFNAEAWMALMSYTEA